MTGNFQNKLPSLSPQQLEKLGQFLDDLMESPAEQVDDEQPAQETKPKRRQKQIARPSQPKQNPKARNQSKSKIKELDSEDLDDLDDEEEDDVRVNRRRSPRAKGRLARIEPVVLSGINKFDQMGERNDARADIAIDKKLWKDRNPVTRSKERFSKVAVRCRECRERFEVNPAVVYVDPDTGKAKYTCDDCVTSRR